MKTRLALRPSHLTSWQCVQDIWKQGAKRPSAFYIGFNAHFIGSIPYTAIDLAVYEAGGC